MGYDRDHPGKIKVKFRYVLCAFELGDFSKYLFFTVRSEMLLSLRAASAFSFYLSMQAVGSEVATGHLFLYCCLFFLHKNMYMRIYIYICV